MPIGKPGPGATARLLQFMTLSTLAATLLWLWWWWPRAPVLAMAGLALGLLGHAWVLALELLAQAWLSRRGPGPRPRPFLLLRAWLREALTAPLVFCWRQPFRSRALPDRLQPGPGASARRGVLLLHGFACNRGLWNPWLRRLDAEGRVCVAINLEPVFGDIDAYVPQIEAAVARLTAATGLPPVLVCHSMGGLAARAWLRTPGADRRVHHVITIASPHQGTWLGCFSAAVNARQMQPGSAWLADLARQEPPARAARFTCWYSDCDNVVLPYASAMLRGARNRLVPGVPHVALALCPQVMEATLAAIRLDRFDGAA